MANIREIQTRINSVKDTMKITNAMYMISSTKMRQAKKKLTDSEPYFLRTSGRDFQNPEAYSLRSSTGILMCGKRFQKRNER